MMKTIKYGVIAAVSFLACGCLPYATGSMKNVYSPTSGVLCDHDKNYCVDKHGVSREETREYLGDEAANNLNPHDMHKRHFTLSNGVFCSIDESTCFTDSDRNFMDRWSTRIIFDVRHPDKHQDNEDNDSSVFMPEKGVVCDKVSHFCADHLGISLSLTKEFFKTTEPLEHILGNVDDVNLSVFTLSNGVYCDSAMKKCFTDRFRTHTEHKITHHLYK